MVIVHGQSPHSFEDLAGRLRRHSGQHEVHVEVEPSSETAVAVVLPSGCSFTQSIQTEVLAWQEAHGLPEGAIRVVIRPPPALAIIHNGDANTIQVVNRLTSRFGWEQVTQLLGIIQPGPPRMLLVTVDDVGSLLEPDDIEGAAEDEFRASGMPSPQMATVRIPAETLRRVIEMPHTAMDLLQSYWPPGFGP